MMNYRKSYNPYLKGLRPRKIFPTVKRNTDKEAMTRDLRKFDPEWNKQLIEKKRA